MSLSVALSRAETLSMSGAFDGSGSASLDVPSTKPLAAAAAAARAARTAAALPSRQSCADLYYFAPEEAAAAKPKFGARAQNEWNKGMAFDADVPADIQKQMRADMGFIGTISGGAGTPLHRKIFGAAAAALRRNAGKTSSSGRPGSRAGRDSGPAARRRRTRRTP